MHPFLDELREGLQRCHLDGSRLLVAVSGGADSVALLRGLVELAPEFSLTLVVGHLNDRLRGAACTADAGWVRDLAATLELPCEIGTVPDEAVGAMTGGHENEARRIRYEFLQQAAARLVCPVIAVAHTADDQAETVLHHLLRGTGIAGLRGIPAVRTTESGTLLVRPLLWMRRTLVEAFLQQINQPFCTDQTNQDLAMTRNRLRHVVLPMLREQINSQVDLALCRLAEQAGEIDEILRSAAKELLNSCLQDRQPKTCRIDVSKLKNQPRHLVREMFRELWQQQAWPRQGMGFDHWNRLVDLLVMRQAVVFPHQIEARFQTENILILRYC